MVTPASGKPRGRPRGSGKKQINTEKLERDPSVDDDEAEGTVTVESDAGEGPRVPCFANVSAARRARGDHITVGRCKEYEDGRLGAAVWYRDKLPIDTRESEIEERFGGGRYIIALRDADGSTVTSRETGFQGEPIEQRAAKVDAKYAVEPAQRLGEDVYAMRGLEPTAQLMATVLQTAIRESRESAKETISMMQENCANMMQMSAGMLESASKAMAAGAGGRTDGTSTAAVAALTAECARVGEALSTERKYSATLQDEIRKLIEENIKLRRGVGDAEHKLKTLDKDITSKDLMDVAKEYAPAVLELGATLLPGPVGDHLRGRMVAQMRAEDAAQSAAKAAAGQLAQPAQAVVMNMADGTSAPSNGVESGPVPPPSAMG